MRYFVAGLFGLLFLVPLITEAQFSVGPRLGATVTSAFDDAQVIDRLRFNNNRTFPLGYLGGVAIGWQKKPNAGLRSEITYVRKGWGERINDPNFERIDTIYTTALDYVEVPIMAHLYLGQRLRYFLNIGLYTGFVVNSSETASISGRGTVNLPDSMVNRLLIRYNPDRDRKFDFGIAGGLGLAYASKIGTFQAEARLAFGLRSVRAINLEPIPRSILNFNLQYTITYLYNFGELIFREKKKEEDVPVIR
jgi:hypothetical protein